MEVPAERVAGERAKIAAGFQMAAKLPGFRPGKAPLKAVEARYRKEIDEETRQELIRKTLQEAVKEKNLNVLTLGPVDEPRTTADGGLTYVATVTLVPEFELPDYSKIPSDVARKPVGDSDVDDLLERLREPHASFEPVEGRPLAAGDFAVITYDGHVDGRPLAEVLPDAPQQLAGRRNAWFLVADTPYMPGFSSKIEGMETGGEREFELVFDSSYPIKDLQGSKITYKVMLHAIQSKQLPPLDDELAAKIEPGSTIADLRAKIRERLEAAADAAFENQKRNAAIKHLLSQVSFEIPQGYVQQEMKSLLHDIVRENQACGISDEELHKHQDEIVGAAEQGAAERVRTNFLLQKVAEKEKIEVTETDLTLLVMELARRYEIPLKKFVNDIKKRGGVHELREQVLARKALDLLAANVTVQTPAEPAA